MARRTPESSWGQRAPQRRPRPLRWRPLLLIVLFGSLLLVWFAPTILMGTAIRDSLLRYALSDFPGQISISSASAGWLSPLSINKVVVYDAQGAEVATALALQTEKNLFSLVLDCSQLGVIRVQQPRVNLVLRDDGSNVEDLLRPLFQEQSSSKKVGCVIEILDGAIAGKYAGKAIEPTAVWSVEKLNATINVPQNQTAPMGARLKAEVAVAKQPPGQLALNAQWQPSADNATDKGGSPFLGTFGLQASSLPLDLLNPWLRLFGADVQLGGLLYTDAEVNLGSASQSAVVKQLSVTNLAMTSPRLLGADRLQLASLEGKGEATRAGGLWQIRGLTVSSDVGQLAMSGSGPAGDAAVSVAEFMGALRNGNGELHGQLEIAKLASTLPHTLRIREATHFASGQMSVDLTSQSQTDGRQWSARLKAENIAAVHQGKQLAWRQPIVAEAAARETHGTISVDHLTCDSSFLRLSGEGTLEQGHLAGDGDLSQFVQELGQFIDLGSFRAAGKLKGQIDWQQGAGQLVALSGNLIADDLALATSTLQPWQEKNLNVMFDIEAKIAGNSLASLQDGLVEVEAAGDFLSAGLTQPVRSLSRDSTWPLRFQLQGDLGQWLTRLQMFFALPGWQLDGDNLDVKGQATISSERIEFAETKGSVENLLAFGPGLYIREPALQFQTTATYDIGSGEFNATRTTVSGTTIALLADKFRLVPQESGPFELDGDVHYRTDLERLASWLRDPSQPQTYRLTGAATGALRFAHDGEVTHADLSADIDEFSYSDAARQAAVTVRPTGAPTAWRELWQEPRLKVALQGSYAAKDDRLELTKMEAAGESLSVGAAGSIQQPLERCNVQITGQYAYDLDRLTEHIRGLIGPQVQLSGTATRPFSLQGPLFAAVQSPGPAAIRGVSTPVQIKTTGASNFQELQVQASIAWKRLLVQGLEIGEGEIDTQLQNGLLTVAPLQLPVSEGTLRLAPRVDLTKTPSLVTLEPGTLVDQVRITPELCRTWLKYVAPLVADATAAEGRFSVKLDDAIFPLQDPTGGNVQGQLLVHAAQIGPGPLSQEIIWVAQQIKTIIERRPLSAETQAQMRWLAMPEQQLNFQLADHRVYHRDLQMSVKDIVIRTQGWVGLDQQLALVAEVPIRDEWVANDRYLASLRGQVVKLPINGSLGRPQVDRRALAELGRQSIREAGTNFLQDQLNRGLERGLDRLFPTKPSPQSPAPPP